MPGKNDKFSIYPSGNYLLKVNNKSTRSGNYLLKVNNRNTRTRCEICSKLTIKTPERRKWLLYFNAYQYSPAIAAKMAWQTCTAILQVNLRVQLYLIIITWNFYSCVPDSAYTVSTSLAFILRKQTSHAHTRKIGASVSLLIDFIKHYILYFSCIYPSCIILLFNSWW